MCPNPNNSTERDLKSESGCGSRKLVGRSLAAGVDICNMSGTFVDLGLDGELDFEVEVELVLMWAMDRNLRLEFCKSKLARLMFLRGEEKGTSCTFTCREVGASCSLLPGVAAAVVATAITSLWTG